MVARRLGSTAEFHQPSTDREESAWLLVQGRLRKPNDDPGTGSGLAAPFYCLHKAGSCCTVEIETLE